MAEQPASVEMEITPDQLDPAVAQVCSEWGVDRGAVEVDVLGPAETAGGGLPADAVRVRVTRRAAPADEGPGLEIARTHLIEILDRMGVAAEVHAEWGDLDEITGIRAMLLDVRGDDLGMLIGRRGEILAALQYLLRLIVAKQLGEGVDLVIDVQGHKRRREEQLRRMARRVAEQAVERQRVMTLEPMPPNERRIIHLELRDHPAVRTESVGEGTHRKVTIIPK